jgi:hypothetical protein
MQALHKPFHCTSFWEELIDFIVKIQLRQARRTSRVPGADAGPNAVGSPAAAAAAAAVLCTSTAPNAAACTRYSETQSGVAESLS